MVPKTGESNCPDSIHELDATKRDNCGHEAFQAKHSAKPGLDVATILLDQIVKALRQAKLRQLGKPALLLKSTNVSMGAA